MATLQTCPTPKELTETDLDTLCQLIEAPSRKRSSMAKAQELQDLAHSSFGSDLVSDVFSAMIKLYSQHLVFPKQQVREMDNKIAEIMSSLYSIYS